MSTLSGTLSTIEVGPYRYPIFTSGDLSANRAVLFIGGLTNGLGAVPFSTPLSDAVGKARWKFVQFHWSSAYGGYGTGSLDRDRNEMELVIKHLRSLGVETIIIAGHSTGSQNVIHYLSNPKLQPSCSPSTSTTPSTGTATGPDGELDLDLEILRVQGGIMQAPASDREFLIKLAANDWFDMLPTAERLVKEGKGDEMLSREFCKKAGFDDAELPINAYRLWSLVGTGGDDDYFSDDIPETPTEPYKRALSTSFGRLSAPLLALYSDGDKAYQEGNIDDRLDRWKKAAGGKMDFKLLENASHDVVQPEAQKVLCETVVEWLERFD